jgi:hypothetical protein
MLSRSTLKNIDFFQGSFGKCKHTKHVCIDNFFSDEIASWLLEDFPAFEQSQQLNEFGDTGLKAVYEKLSDISPRYRKISDYLASAEFNQLIQKICGDDSVYWGGESMYGGGTHENLNGIELDQHVDFNYNDLTGEHRRLNLLIYLNPTWEEAWGGQLELHSNPLDRMNNEITSFSPLFNRAILMETTETIWHGFPRINIPEQINVSSRKSLALYFYSKTRPADEVASGHGTVYIHRKLPSEFKTGAVITEDLFNEINYLIDKRDSFLSLYQQREKLNSERMKSVISYNSFLSSQLRLPILGMVEQIDAAIGFYAEKFIGSEMSVEIRAFESTSSIEIEFFARQALDYPLILECMFNEESIVELCVSEPGTYSFKRNLHLSSGSTGVLTLKASNVKSGQQEGTNLDDREFSVLIKKIIFRN